MTITNNKKIDTLLAWGLVVVYAGAIFFFSSLSNPLPENLSSNDKVLHSIEYAVFAVLIFRAFIVSKIGASKNFIIVLTIVISTLYGVSDEFHQFFVPSRTMSGLDLFFDFLGSFFGVLMYNRFKIWQ